MTSHPVLPEPIYVTRPLIPAWASIEPALRAVFESGTLTNMGPWHQRLEQQLQERLGHGHLSLWNNGTNALLGMLSQFDLSGEVVVTPFTFPATVHAIATLGLTPVFADVRDDDLTLSAESVKERVTEQTSAVLGTHVYGNFCDTVGLAKVASEGSRERPIRVLYDGAHIFGRKAPVFEDATEIGDATILSFHATKLYHTVEGGAIVTPDADQHRRFRTARNFGILGEEHNTGVGLNGKMSEVHAAVGTVVLDHLDQELQRRADLAARYTERLRDIEGIRILSGDGTFHQYMTIRVDGRIRPGGRDVLRQRLLDHNVVSRKYFFPLCSDIDVYRDLPSARGLDVAERAAQECLVLPLYGDLPASVVDYICDLVDDFAGE
ncbi:DegT/DnrJ/EryC1/StrS aminotransferase family protein [Cellulomonas sp. C5510]|uniref:DegT/DnrJ/EryC1/StrS family aminotransferase n=1 Tax=Cellulomonas sp. C5510 TaxID=2871170 RepID=UPI001C974578|nr:DegT/DnrJ/EryC1/StrS family aminotransferase [Cellulomonas sp. C5510]QZN84776.1 DegT/DnrJ/EryC1/StrS family aminotransferase [Cellulomonas sp. C5510]